VTSSGIRVDFELRIIEIWGSLKAFRGESIVLIFGVLFFWTPIVNKLLWAVLPEKGHDHNFRENSTAVAIERFKQSQSAIEN
jgi:hypothetical protein